jgi:hypothetical protein
LIDVAAAALRRSRDPLVAAAVVLGLSCAVRQPFVRPVGPGGPAADAAGAWQEAVAGCRSTTTYRSELGITGRIGAQRIRGLASARLYAAVTAAGEIGLEAYVASELVFKLGGAGATALLLLRDGNRVVDAPPEEILEALIGVRLTPPRLLAILAGCVSGAPMFHRASSHGQLIEVAADDATLFLERQSGAWRVRAGTVDQLQVDYWRFDRMLPRVLGVRTAAGHEPVVVLEMQARDTVVNSTIDPAAFLVRVPAGARRMTIQELRDSGWLASQPSEASTPLPGGE